LLKTQGYETESAASGEEALKKVLKNNYALILLDVQMPLMDGFEVAQLVKGNNKSKDIPIIFLTAISKEKKFVIRGLLSGAVDYLTKPVDDELLILKVQAFLKLYNQQQELNYLNKNLETIAEERAKEITKQKAYFQQLFENSPDAILMLDNNANVMNANDAFVNIFGFELKKIIGKDIDDFILPEYLIEEKEGIKEKIFGSEVMRIETKRKRADDTLFDVNILAYPIMLNNSFVGVYVIYRDITANSIMIELLEKERDRAEEMNKLKSFFLANMSHELRTPLISVLGFAEMLQEELTDPEQKDLVKEITNGGQRLNVTLNSILEFAKLESEKSTLKLSHTNIVTEIEKNIEGYSSLAKSKNLFIQKEFGGDIFMANIDPELFSKAFCQLLHNAIKFTDNGGVFVTLNEVKKADVNWVVMQIIDTGIGIAEEDYKTIFMEFRQGSEGYSRSYEGNGLGLSIAKKMIELMHGKIDIESEEGKGSTFSVWLPAVLDNQALNTIIEKRRNTIIIEPTIKKTSTAPTVLLVEDNQANRLLINRMLAKDFEVKEAEDGFAALAIVSTKIFNLVLMDINLGSGLDGIETMLKIRKIPGYADIPIIAVTAFAMSGDRERLLAKGFDDYLQKPFTNAELSKLVKKLIA